MMKRSEISYSLLLKVLMEQFLPTDRQEQEKHIQCKVKFDKQIK